MQQQQEILSSAVERDLIKDEVATLSTRKEKDEKAIKEIEAQYVYCTQRLSDWFVTSLFPVQTEM